MAWERPNIKLVLPTLQTTRFLGIARRIKKINNMQGVPFTKKLKKSLQNYSVPPKLKKDIFKITVRLSSPVYTARRYIGAHGPTSNRIKLSTFTCFQKGTCLPVSGNTENHLIYCVLH